MSSPHQLLPPLALVLSLACAGTSTDRRVARPSTPPYPLDAVLEDGARNAYRWPFASDSIWNTPLGAEATYVPAHIPAAGAMGLTVDEDLVIQRPAAPLRQVFAHDAGWDPRRSRCGSIQRGRVLLGGDGVPVPDDYWTDPGFRGTTPNHSAAIVMPDGRTVRQTQPLHVCGPGGPVVSQYSAADQDLVTGDGRLGSHGGSGLSSLGGTLRVGELVPGATLRHALKVNLQASRNLSYDEDAPTPGYRWPAANADGYAGDASACGGYRGTVPALRMGALLALRPEFDVEGLRTEPARILARALRDYGAYVADDSCWDVYAFAAEWGPDGRVVDEFREVWGFPMETSKLSTCTATDDPECRWARDMADVFTNLHVVDDNGPSSVGGAGARRGPIAPAARLP